MYTNLKILWKCLIFINNYVIVINIFKLGPSKNKVYINFINTIEKN